MSAKYKIIFFIIGFGLIVSGLRVTKQLAISNSLAIALLPETSTQKVSKTPLTKETLSNAEYHVSDYGSFKLTNGSYRNQETKLSVSGGKTITLGDLNNDGIKDAVTLLTVNGGGSGIFEYLAVIINEKGSLKNAATEYLGDRVVVQSVSISAGKIKVVMLTQGPGDGLCCPRLKVAQTYILQGNKLKRIGYKKLPST
ncbi:hypothetical protein G7B40_029425 [Aetokthonos hydrillicola Thurmond2011]|uniref:VCBS repeat-containing protein n=1 Tax=Aetokthonos hydrillicola Thurmond2011 TaxID=2712845 RepID=A0AAP5ICJ1_9CYAN|nr:hypothetical protein [Aetokthonos hydrillicola]MBO3457140.1 hypothetical protein [Aetokthonos hydrillicola CCALA 1050]MBW4587486.1 hypothetical protein [Aetokthonos hydrillicola CCALA 1050]MDR9898649.1 hypothetical protein [Aetokthonos hydrillicola Thurmond2011]